MIGFCVVSWLAGTIWGDDDRGKTLDEITRDRYGDEIDENGWLLSFLCVRAGEESRLS